MPNLMVDNHEDAKANRERIARQENHSFYAQQRRAVAQWQFGEPAPESVVLGELPYVGRHRAVRRESDD